jgi:DNA-binding MarR family transcriptional regulator
LGLSDCSVIRRSTLGTYPDDRRASRAALSTAGKRKLTAALKTYEAEVAGILGGVLRPEEQQQMSDYVARLLTSIAQAEAT